MIGWFYKIELIFLVLLYLYFIFLAIRYFNKSTIEETHYFNVIKYLGLLLIFLILFLGFTSSNNNLYTSVLNILLISMSFLLLYTATNQHIANPLNFAFSKSTPNELTVDGVYKFIRHPIYTGYILGWIAGFLNTLNLIIVPLILIMVFVYHQAINKEEKEFLSGPLSREYEEYIKNTTKFIPFIY